MRYVLIVLITLGLALPGLAGDFIPTQSATVDLNGDGKPDTIAVKAIAPAGTFRLTINDQSITGKLSNPTDGLVVVDLLRGDKLQEIDVHTPGPSDDDQHRLFWYDGKTIRPASPLLMRWPEFNANGIVYMNDWMGFWEQTDKYVLNTKTHMLEKVPQEFYYVGKEAKVEKSIPICQTRGNNKVVANLLPKSTVQVLIYSNGWYLLKSSTNLTGWIREKEIYGGNFSGLLFAD